MRSQFEEDLEATTKPKLGVRAQKKRNKKAREQQDDAIAAAATLAQLGFR